MIAVKIALFLNPTKVGIFEYAKHVVEKLNTIGAEVYFCENYGQSLFEKYVYLKNDINELVKFCDVVLTLGGDGTIIHFAKYAAKFSKPILGINLGRLGFVTGLEKNELDKLERLVDGQYSLQQRALLEVSVYTEDNDVKVFWALNDAVISRGFYAKIVDFIVKLNGGEVCKYRADGIISATSTGSTAYSLSAGGPIISPDVDCVLLTPICSHSIFAKPIVFSKRDSIDIIAKTAIDADLSLVVDGNNVLDFSNYCKLNVKCANKKVSVITFDERCFCKRLAEKLLDK